MPGKPAVSLGMPSIGRPAQAAGRGPRLLGLTQLRKNAANAPSVSTTTAATPVT